MNLQSLREGHHPYSGPGVRMVESPEVEKGVGGGAAARDRLECPSRRWPTPTAAAIPAEGGRAGRPGSGPQGPSSGAGGRAGGGEAWCRRRCRARRSAPYRHVPHREKAPTAVARRNARERRRVEAVNGAFLRLRRAVPPEGPSSGGAVERGKRVSKVKTLHRAIEYITQLQGILSDAGCQFTLGSYGQRNEINHHSAGREGIHDGQADAVRWREAYENGYRESQMEYSCGMLQPYRDDF